MTEGQLRYHTLAENARHNLAMERINERQTSVKEREVALSEEKQPYEILKTQRETRKLWMEGTVGAFKAAESFTSAFKNAMTAIGTIGSLVSGI